MKLLCLSNGHGEDIIALRILQALQQSPSPPDLAALPIVGTGQAYQQHGIPIVGTVKPLPSGGFLYMDSQQLIRDLRGGLVQLTWEQLKTVRSWAKSGGVILAVGDIVPLLMAWWSGAPYAFVGTAKSEYYIRDEQGILPRGSWFEQFESRFGSVYLPWERWLMRHPRCQAVFPRDRLTTDILQQWPIPALNLGNPMMDGLTPTPPPFTFPPPYPHPTPLTLLLLPGSRPPEAYQNWQVILQAVMSLVHARPDRSLRFLAAITPSLDLNLFQQALEPLGWQPHLSGTLTFPTLTFPSGNATLLLVPSAFGDCLHQADMAIAMAGTATEQFVGLGKPAMIIPGEGPQFTPAFAEAQTRLLGCSVVLVEHPDRMAEAVRSLLQQPERLQQIRDNGLRRMGQPGAAQRIADCLIQRFGSHLSSTVNSSTANSSIANSSTAN